MSKLKVHRAPPRHFATTQFKDGLNRVLNLAGLQVSTIKADQVERARLDELVARQHWAATPYQCGLHFDAASYCRFLQMVCGPFVSDLSSLPATADPADEGYFLKNTWFESVDAEILYGIIRHYWPRQIIEVGCGYSTRLMRRAINDGHLQTTLTCIDPSPRVAVRSFADEHIESAVEHLPASELTGRLAANDILFIDSSHVVASGGDVPYLLLEVLPKLADGVLIHVHDIFLPFEYPERFLRMRLGWTEQYLLHALLCDNPRYEILWPSYYMWQCGRQTLLQAIQVPRVLAAPSSFWIRRIR